MPSPQQYRSVDTRACSNCQPVKIVMQTDAMPRVDQLMRKAIDEDVFPGGVLMVSDSDHIKFFGAYGCANRKTRAPMTRDTVFDLASLTKPLATTPAVMQLVRAGKLDLDQPVGSILPDFAESDKGDIRVRHLLKHTSGLPDYYPFYRELQNGPFEQRVAALRQKLIQLPLRHTIGSAVCYSDLGFILLGWIVEYVSGQRLDEFVRRFFFIPLGLDGQSDARLCFVDLNAPVKFISVAATESCAWREKLLEGIVHDDNAYVMGGIAGHAGLFGNARGIHCLSRALMAAYDDKGDKTLFQPELVRRFFHRDAPGDRPLGFDAPSPVDASCGRYFSERTVGHLGFTGTSFWLDLERSVAVILLTNRVHPSRTNERIKNFRPVLHDAVMECLF